MTAPRPARKPPAKKGPAKKVSAKKVSEKETQGTSRPPNEWAGARTYRTAAFLHTVVEPVGRRLAAGRDIWGFASDLTRERLGLKEASGGHAGRGIASEVNDIVAYANELHWFWAGIEVGYFDDRRPAVKKAAEEAGLADEYALAEAIAPRRAFSGAIEFHRQLTLAQDAYTPEFHECVWKLLFADHETDWQPAIRRLDDLAAAMNEDPALSLPAAEVDAVAWALTGADDLIDWIDTESYDLHVTLRAISTIESEETPAPGAAAWGYQGTVLRLEELRGRRDTIAAAAQSLTEDVAAAASKRLAASISTSQGSSSARPPSAVQRLRAHQTAKSETGEAQW